MAYSVLPDDTESGCISIQSNVCQTYCKVCFWCRVVFLSFCTTVLNSSGWNSFLASCLLCLLEELLLCVQYISFIFWYCYCWTVKSDSDCQLIPPVHKVSLLSFLLVSGLALLCHHMVAYHPCPQRSRETGTFFQSLKLNQTVSHSYWNFSNMFVAELVVIDRVNHFIGHSLEGQLAYSCSQGVKHWVVSLV